jgi:hypothetical protein
MGFQKRLKFGSSEWVKNTCPSSMRMADIQSPEGLDRTNKHKKGEHSSSTPLFLPSDCLLSEFLCGEARLIQDMNIFSFWVLVQGIEFIILSSCSPLPYKKATVFYIFTLCLVTMLESLLRWKAFLENSFRYIGNHKITNKNQFGCREKEALIHCWWECKLI